MFRGCIFSICGCKGSFAVFQKEKNGRKRIFGKLTRKRELMLLHAQNDKQGKKRYDDERREHGRNADGTEHEGVCAEKLDKGSAKSVPDEVPKADLTLKFSLFIEDIDQHEAKHVPKGFVKERGVDVHRHISCVEIVDAHAPGERGFRAERLAVHEVAPSADGLREHDAGGRHIRELEEGDLLDARHHENGERAEEDTAVDGKTAFPNGDDVIKRFTKIFPEAVARHDIFSDAVEYDVVKSCADDGDADGDERDI